MQLVHFITHKEILKKKSKFLFIICRKRRIFGFGTPLDVFSRKENGILEIIVKIFNF
jgi:hypothetical protein